MKQIKTNFQDCYVGDYTNDPRIDVTRAMYDGNIIIKVLDPSKIVNNICCPDTTPRLFGTMIFKLVKFKDALGDVIFLVKCIRRDFPWEDNNG